MKMQTVRTPCLRLTQIGANLPRAHADHTKALCLVECPDLLLRLAERHAVRKFTELCLCIRFFGLAGTSASGLSETRGRSAEKIKSKAARTACHHVASWGHHWVWQEL